jgi:hypothetical protein
MGTACILESTYIALGTFSKYITATSKFHASEWWQAWSKLHIQDKQTSEATVQNSAVRMTWHPELVHPRRSDFKD